MPILQLIAELLKRPLIGVLLGGMLLVQTVLALKGIEHHPFLLYGMYSEPNKPSDDVSFRITINDKDLRDWELAELPRSLIENCLTKMKKKEMDYFFFLWLKHYISKQIDAPVHLKVIKVKDGCEYVLHDE